MPDIYAFVYCSVPIEIILDGQRNAIQKWRLRQANFVASLNKMAVDQAKKRYPEMEVPNERPFMCLSFAGSLSSISRV